VDQPRRMGHEYAGIVEDAGSAVTTIRPGRFVVGSFLTSDNTGEICRAGYQAMVTRQAIKVLLRP
jgi:Zn-dependent alcohol dehydrogenase